jgi:hypothetical protein
MEAAGLFQVLLDIVGKFFGHLLQFHFVFICDEILWASFKSGYIIIIFITTIKGKGFKLKIENGKLKMGNPIWQHLILHSLSSCEKS